MATPGMPDLTSRQLQTILAAGGIRKLHRCRLIAEDFSAGSDPYRQTRRRSARHQAVRSQHQICAITAAGKEFAAVAGRMLNDLKITLQSMRELSDQRRGQIIISSIMSVANGKLPGLVSAYRRDYPGIELHVRDGVHGTVIEDVRSGTADFGITYLDDLPDPFVSVPIGSEAFTVVLPRNS